LDAVFIGESESSFLQYLEALNGAGEMAEIDNAVVRDAGRIYASDTMMLIKRKQRDSEGHWAEIDEIPYPAWHHYNMEKYFSIGAYQSPYTVGGRVGQIYTSRGCTAKCTFCTTTNFWGSKLRRRSPANVVGELEILKQRYKIDEYHIQDDNITNDKAHAKALFDSLKAVNLPWCTPAGTALR
jgi:anaerobic magnesium-protoporphyrin IX monomethyl ester cyclase